MPTPRLEVPTRRSSLGLLAAVGGGVLAAGLLLPFIVGSPSGEVIASGPTPSFSGAAPTGNEDSGAGEGAFSEAGDVASEATGPIGSGPTLTPTDANGTESSSGVGAGGTDAPGTGSVSNQPLTASDVGVTANTIKIGVLIPNTDEIEGADEYLGDVREQWQVSVDSVNAAGGILGRKIEAVYEGFDALSDDAKRASCIRLTEEEKVFAVVNGGGFFGEPIRCVTEQHDTPMIGQPPGDDSYYLGNLFTITPSKDRVLKNYVTRLHREGRLRGKTIGTLEIEGRDKIPIDRSMIPVLESLGYKVAHRAVFNEDLGTAQSQMPVEIQQMRSKGVDFVLPGLNLGHMTTFVQTADGQGYRPTYFMSDYVCGTCDVFLILMPEGSFEGVLGYTSLRSGEWRVDLPEVAHDRRCREQYEASTGKTVSREGGEYSGVVQSCGIVDIFAAAARASGPNLTQDGLTAALQGRGEFAVPFSGIGSFRPGKFDAPDASRTVVASTGCRCWTPVDDFTRDPF